MSFDPAAQNPFAPQNQGGANPYAVQTNNPYATPQASYGAGQMQQGSDDGRINFYTVQPLLSAAGWLKFMGICQIVVGVIYCISIIGILFGWLPLWIGYLLNKAGTSFEAARRTRSERALHEGFTNLNTVITIMGVLTAIGVAMMALYIVAIIIMVAIGGAAALTR